MDSHQLTPIIDLLFIRNDEIVLLRPRAAADEPALYHLPTGFLQVGEDLKTAACRVAGSEMRVKVKPGDLQLAQVMRWATPTQDTVRFIYEAHIWVGKVCNGMPKIYDQIIWADMDKLPKNTMPFTKEVAKNFRRAKLFSEVLAL